MVNVGDDDMQETVDAATIDVSDDDNDVEVDIQIHQSYLILIHLHCIIFKAKNKAGTGEEVQYDKFLGRRFK